jgi:hypothetical protein
MELGEAVPSTSTSWSLSLASTLLIPSSSQISANLIAEPVEKSPCSLEIDPDTSLTQPSQVIGTAKVVCSNVSNDAGVGAGESIMET